MDAVPRRSPDVYLFAATVALIGIGIVMIYSASAIVALDWFGDSAFFLKRQLLWSVLGLGVMSVSLTIHYQRLRRITPALLLLVAVALVAVLIPGIGRLVGGARRWLVLGPASFQPAEAAKLFLVLYLANYLTNRGAAVRQFRTLRPPLLVTAALFLLVVVQPDMGSAFLLVGITGMMLFLGGASIWHLAGVMLAGHEAADAVTILEPYRVRRLMAFLDPWRDPQGSGFHIIQSLLALGSGGLLGVGLGASRQKFFYLPERHTDFIFAILGEELGLVGAALVIALLAFVAYRGFRIARSAPDRYGALLAAGITSSIVGQAMLNIGVTAGIAVAEVVQARVPGAEILFVGGTRLEAHVLREAGWSFETVAAHPLPRRIGLSLVSSTAVNSAGTVQSLGLLRRWRADVVLATGGYVAGPVGLAAVILGIPLVLQEQNMLPGLANFWLARWARAISVPALMAGFPADRVVVTGVPVRPSVLRGDRERARRAFGLADRFTILVLGGSQGALSLNRAVGEAATLMMYEPIQILHQTGREHLEWVRREVGHRGPGGAPGVRQIPLPFIR